MTGGGGQQCPRLTPRETGAGRRRTYPRNNANLSGAPVDECSISYLPGDACQRHRRLPPSTREGGTRRRVRPIDRATQDERDQTRRRRRSQTPCIHGGNEPPTRAVRADTATPSGRCSGGAPGPGPYRVRRRSRHPLPAAHADVETGNVAARPGEKPNHTKVFIAIRPFFTPPFLTCTCRRCLHWRTTGRHLRCLPPVMSRAACRRNCAEGTSALLRSGAERWGTTARDNSTSVPFWTDHAGRRSSP